MKKFLSLFLCLCFFISAACAETPVSCGDLLADLADAFRHPLFSSSAAGWKIAQ